MSFDQGRLRDVEAGSGSSHRGTRRARCAHASFGERRMALSDRCDRPPPVVQARNQPPDAVQCWTSGLLYPRKRADWPSIWGMRCELTNYSEMEENSYCGKFASPTSYLRRTSNNTDGGQTFTPLCS